MYLYVTFITNDSQIIIYNYDKDKRREGQVLTSDRRKRQTDRESFRVVRGAET